MQKNNKMVPKGYQKVAKGCQKVSNRAKEHPKTPLRLRQYVATGIGKYLLVGPSTGNGDGQSLISKIGIARRCDPRNNGSKLQKTSRLQKSDVSPDECYTT